MCVYVRRLGVTAYKVSSIHPKLSFPQTNIRHETQARLYRFVLKPTNDKPEGYLVQETRAIHVSIVGKEFISPASG